MRFISTMADYPPHFLRNACRWHNRETGCVPSTIGRIMLEPKTLGTQDWSYRRDGRDLTISVFEHGPAPGKALQDAYHINDRTDVIVWLLFWAMFATSGQRRGARVPVRAKRMMRIFNADRDNLLTDWYCPPPPRGKKCVAEGSQA